MTDAITELLDLIGPEEQEVEIKLEDNNTTTKIDMSGIIWKINTSRDPWSLQDYMKPLQENVYRTTCNIHDTFLWGSIID